MRSEPKLGHQERLGMFQCLSKWPSDDLVLAVCTHPFLTIEASRGGPSSR